MRKRTLMWILLAGGLLMQPAFADPGDRWQRRDPRMQQMAPQGPQPFGQRRGASEAARIAQERNGGGKVLGVSPTDDGYRVKIIKKGEVRTLTVPSQ